MSKAPARLKSGQAKSGARAKPGGRKAVRLSGNPAAAQAQASAEAGPPRKRGDEVRERILRAALECFAAFGFEGTSTRAVAERAGLTHTLIIYHFETKDQLWISTMDAAVGGYVDGLQAATEVGEQGPAEALKTFINHFVRMSADRPEVHRIMTMESNQNTPRLEYVIDTYARKNFLAVCDLIRRGQSEGKVRQCDPARLYYHILGAGGTPFTTASEYRKLTGRDIFSEQEILRTIAFIYDIVFTEQS